MVNVKDYYTTLGVERGAKLEDIKKAYRKLARQYHPDVNPDNPSAEDQFKAINEAYEVLSDAEKRAKYDQFGSEWAHYTSAGGRPEDFDWSAWGGSASSAGDARYRRVTPDEFESMFGGGGFSDFFENLFGQRGSQTSGGFNGYYDTGASEPRSRHGQDIEHAVEVSLAEAFHGCSRVLTYDDGRTIEARIPRGVRTGSKVRLAGKGQAGPRGGAPGDLYLVINVAVDPHFERDGDDLVLKQPIDLYTALLGGSVRVNSIDKSVDLTIPPLTQNGRVFRLRGLGMPNLRKPDTRGALLITVEVRLPDTLSDEQRELVERLRTISQDKR
jgi:curved DNA-binding protein